MSLFLAFHFRAESCEKKKKNIDPVLNLTPRWRTCCANFSLSIISFSAHKKEEEEEAEEENIYIVSTTRKYTIPMSELPCFPRSLSKNSSEIVVSKSGGQGSRLLMALGDGWWSRGDRTELNRSNGPYASPLIWKQTNIFTFFFTQN